ncbi:Cro/C1-type helix-turn-helix domain [Moorella glycerini]|uniref:HTH-type transcriptional regulator ImmR n=1 Tax=Neomoorella stamsii TaxID=1266720 RepID=A0A9X7J0G0_9FIRM|nr:MULTISPECIES: helix-turn-helix domain-containing protein [Moorella]PRR69641.1 HTH-type transcriptional regulator ImmR [Moorella stamsii]CEP67835.1 Cro/C1-type helix-turn-helix domain [Moorella glycerini]
MAFAERLTRLRERKGLTQEDLAKKLNISRSALSLWEIGKREPNFETTTKIADFFGVSVDYLLGRTDDPRSLKEKVFDPTYEPTEVDLEELLQIANIRFMGEKLAKQDKDKLLQIAKILWEERRKIKQEEGD